MLVRYIVILISTSFLLASCGNDTSYFGEPINNGSADRDNSYEFAGEFYKMLWTSKMPKDAPDTSYGAIQAPIAFDTEKIIIAQRSGGIACVGAERHYWTSQLDDEEFAASAVVADPAQNIYLVSNVGKMYSYDRNGNLRWKKLIADTVRRFTIFSDPIALHDKIIYADSEGKVSAIDTSGKILWAKVLSPEPLKSFAVKNDIIYIPLTHNKYGATDSLVALNVDSGDERWAKAFEGYRFINGPSVSVESIILSGFKGEYDQKSNVLISLDPDGNLKWEESFDYTIRSVSIASNGDIFVSAYNAGVGKPLSEIYRFDKDGKLIWDKFFEATIPSQLLISESNVGFLAIAETSQAFFFLFRDKGNVDEMIDLSNAEIIRSTPTVNPVGNIIFAGADKLITVKLDDTPLNKFLPY